VVVPVAAYGALAETVAPGVILAAATMCKPNSRKLDIHNRKMMTNDDTTALE
jgi:hypothetical protein